MKKKHEEAIGSNGRNGTQSKHVNVEDICNNAEQQ